MQLQPSGSPPTDCARLLSSSSISVICYVSAHEVLHGHLPHVSHLMTGNAHLANPLRNFPETKCLTTLGKQETKIYNSRLCQIIALFVHTT